MWKQWLTELHRKKYQPKKSVQIRVICEQKNTFGGARLQA
ncbi:hypothetical protein NIASO_08850 [Niabella soli DSM 19437]|uniref:Uncharacterized protein n=1 Tax=Niabella soli DSM 19437 TaxID=929713 RepID=W0F6P7_9BACT|nr:hypothetical protein NIASO_08850 [Niabella soli DSM 19437]